ncbi:MAG: 5'/3'-nucleotidase SurE, partial [Planctomycetota bacterium]
MRILLTNDDGIFAPGLAAIYNELVKLGDVTVVAPAQSHSGMSHSITFHAPLACSKVDVKGQFSGYRVQGSPADCVKLAAMQIIEEPIDLVVAGINDGANIGINVYYSGTVAAAMEGQFLSIPSVAMSLAAE